MMKAGMHLGHPVQKWDPKMGPFLYNKKLHSFLSKKKHVTIHLIDLVKTLTHMSYLSARLTKMALRGKKILFVGTQNQYAPLIARAAKACRAYYINEKWLGGLLTNWETVSLSTDRLRKFDILIKDGTVQNMPKKEAARAMKYKNKLQKLLGGIKYIPDKPDLVIILGQLKEINALNECKKLNIPSISIVDTNCNPMASDLLIPLNDDSNPALQSIFNLIVVSIRRGQLLLEESGQSKSFRRVYDKVRPLRKKTWRSNSRLSNHDKLEENKTEKSTVKKIPLRASKISSVSSSPSPVSFSKKSLEQKKLLEAISTNGIPTNGSTTSIQPTQEKSQRKRKLQKHFALSKTHPFLFKALGFEPFQLLEQTLPMVTETGERLVVQNEPIAPQPDEYTLRMSRKPAALLPRPVWSPLDKASIPITPVREVNQNTNKTSSNNRFFNPTKNRSKSQNRNRSRGQNRNQNQQRNAF